MSRVLTTNSENLELVAKKMKQLDNKCKKYGFTLNYEISNPYLKEHTVYNENDEKKLYSYMVEVVDVTIEEDSLSFMLIEGDYKLIAKLEKITHSDINFVKLYDSSYTVEEFQTVDLICEHCHTNRDRKYGFIIQDMRTNKLLQIGKSCVADYLNSLDILKKIAIYDTIEELDFSDMGGTYSVQKAWFPMLDVIYYTLVCNNKYGFTKRSDGGYCTSEQVSDLIYAMYSDDFRVKEILMKTHKYNLEEKYMDEAREILNAILDCNIPFITNNDFNRKVIDLCKNGFVSYQHLAMAIFTVPLYNKIVEQQEKQKSNYTKGADIYFGSVGDKINLSLKFLNTFTYDAFFNGSVSVMKIHRFMDEENRIFVWKTSSWLKDELKTGETVMVKGSIKEHNEYRDEKQTVLTRCKVSKTN